MTIFRKRIVPSLLLGIHVLAMLVVLATLPAGCKATSGNGQPTVELIVGTDTPVDGKAAFASYCAGCHGAEGKGGSAPAIRPARFTYDELFEIIADGRPNTAMKGWRGEISEGEVDAIITYLGPKQ